MIKSLTIALSALMVTAASALEAATIALDQTDVTSISAVTGETVSLEISLEIPWDYPVQQVASPDVADIASHAQFGSLNIFVDGDEVAALGRPFCCQSTYTQNPSFAGVPSGRTINAGRRTDTWSWAADLIFDREGTFDLEFQGSLFFWRAVLPASNPSQGGFIGAGRYDFGSSATVEVSNEMIIAPVPLPASLTMILASLGLLGFVGRPLIRFRV